MTKKIVQHTKQNDRADKSTRRTLSPLGEEELRQVAGGVLKTRHDPA